jgi:hypothetical protein
MRIQRTKLFLHLSKKMLYYMTFGYVKIHLHLDETMIILTSTSD